MNRSLFILKNGKESDSEDNDSRKCLQFLISSCGDAWYLRTKRKKISSDKVSIKIKEICVLFMCKSRSLCLKWRPLTSFVVEAVVNRLFLR